MESKLTLPSFNTLIFSFQNKSHFKQGPFSTLKYRCMTRNEPSFILGHVIIQASFVAQLVKNHLPCERPGLDPWVGKIPWRRERLPILVFWPGEFHGLGHNWATFTFIFQADDSREPLCRPPLFYLHAVLSYLVLCPGNPGHSGLSKFSTMSQLTKPGGFVCMSLCALRLRNLLQTVSRGN